MSDKLSTYLSCDNRSEKLLEDNGSIKFFRDWTTESRFVLWGTIEKYLGSPPTAGFILNEKEHEEALLKLGLKIVTDQDYVWHIERAKQQGKVSCQEFHSQGFLRLFSPRLTLLFSLCQDDSSDVGKSLRKFFEIEYTNNLWKLLLFRSKDQPTPIQEGIKLLQKPSLELIEVYTDASVSPSSNKTTIAAYCPSLGQAALQLISRIFSVEEAEMAAISMAFQEFPSLQKVYTDSKNCVTKINEARSVPEAADDRLIALKEPISRKIKNNAETVIWIPRERNFYADALSHEAYYAGYTGFWEVAIKDCKPQLVKIIRSLKSEPQHQKFSSSWSLDNAIRQTIEDIDNIDRELEGLHQQITEKEDEKERFKTELQALELADKIAKRRSQPSLIAS
jgi:hypothetical protein